MHWELTPNKLGINKKVHVTTSFNNLKTNIDDLDVGQLKTVPVDLKQINYVVKNEVVKKTKFITLTTKVNKSDKKIPDAKALIHINQCNTDTENLDKKVEMSIKKLDVGSLVAKTLSNTKCGEIENKIPYVTDLRKKTWWR